METEMRLIDANPIIEWFSGGESVKSMAESIHDERFVGALRNAPVVDAAVLPCRIGDRVWAIRNFHGVKRPQEGIVNEMFFTNQMELCIVVKHVARGIWGKTVFGSYGDAQSAISRERSGMDAV